MIGCPIVNALNRARSAGSFQGRRPSLPITPFSETATMRETSGRFDNLLYRDRGFDPRVRIVMQHLDILVPEGKKIAHLGIEP